MLRKDFGQECKVCARPFTVFKWSPGEGMRWKKTEICQTCAKIKNACQCCMLDLDYGISTKIRDSVLDSKGAMPTDQVNTLYHVRNMEEQMGDNKVVNHGRAESAAKEVLKKLARKGGEPYQSQDQQQQKSRTMICSFFLRGTCKRGETCPLRHEKPKSYQGGDNKDRPDRSAAAGGPSGSGSGSAAAGTQAAHNGSNNNTAHTKRRSYVQPPQSHAEAHAKSQAVAAASEASLAPSSKGKAKAAAPPLAAFPMGPPPPPGEGPAPLYPSQDPSILGTATRSFRT